MVSNHTDISQKKLNIYSLGLIRLVMIDPTRVVRKCALTKFIGYLLKKNGSYFLEIPEGGLKG